MLRSFLAALVAAVLLEALARGRRVRWSAWARGVLTWSGLLLAVLLLNFGVAWLTDPSAREGPAEAVMGFAVAALVYGGTFFTAGFLVGETARRYGWPRWVRHGLVLLSALPGLLAGWTVVETIASAASGQPALWNDESSLGQSFGWARIWLLANVAVAVGIVRMLYDLRVEALEDRQRRLEAEATAARLAALEGQIRPHVLFNALSGLAGLIPEDAARAEAMTLALARLLRRSLDRDAAPTATLADELAFVQDYLDVERCRLGDRLRVRLDVADEVRDVPVPRFVLQPLVENAIKHGAGGRAGTAMVAVSGRRDGDRLELAVADDGPAFPDGWLAGTGLGGVRDRLALLYGDGACLAVETTPKRVVVTLPTP